MNALITHDLEFPLAPVTFIESSEAKSLSDSQFRPTPNSAIKTAFLVTSMPVGGAETLLVNLVRGFDPNLISPQIVCLKEPGPLGDEIQKQFLLRSNFLSSKWDLRVLEKLRKHFVKEQIQAIVTVGAGDKMFWGRLAAKLAKVPVVCSALHSTGWPDGVGRCNRMLTGITDAFIAVADTHGKFLCEFEKFPKTKVVVIPNGIDTNRFAPNQTHREQIRSELGIPFSAPVVGIVAALRPEKNHRMFVDVAAKVQRELPNARFLIIGEGPERGLIESAISELGITNAVHMLGNRHDTDRVLNAMDVFALTSHNEANPVSILEALATKVPVVSTRVGSIPETVINGETGYCLEPKDSEDMSRKVISLLLDASLRSKIGNNGRKRVEANSSLKSMVDGYTNHIHRIHRQKCDRKR